MSTKTSIKRIALVAVSALGFGLLSVVPARAEGATNSINGYLVTQNGNRAGIQSALYVKAVANSNTEGDPAPATYTTLAVVTARPAGSTVELNDINEFKFDGGAAGAAGTLTLVGDGAAAVSTTAEALWTPDLPGTYRIVVWHDEDVQDDRTAGERATTITVEVVADDAPVSVTVSTLNTTSIEGGSFGVAMSVTIKNSKGVPTRLSAFEQVNIAVTGLASAWTSVDTLGSAEAFDDEFIDEDTDEVDGSLVQDNFSKGVAYLNITDATDGTTVVTITGESGTALSANRKSVSLSFKNDSTATVDEAALGDMTLDNDADGAALNVAAVTVPAKTAATATFAGILDTEDAQFATTNYYKVEVEDTSDINAPAYAGLALGAEGWGYDRAITTNSDGEYSFDIAVAFLDNVQQLTVKAFGETFTIEGDTPTAESLSHVNDIESYRVLDGGMLSFTLEMVDQFGSGIANETINITVAGRNSKSAVLVTNESGQITYSYTDTVGAAGTLASDTVIFDGTESASASVTYVSSLGVSTVTLTYPGDEDTVAGTSTTDISAAAGGATGTSASIVATVKDENGSVLVGVPVTFAVAGLTGAEVHTNLATVITNSEGKATGKVSSYAAGKATVTVTAAGKSATANIYFKQETAEDARTITATATNGIITATVKDRYGNPIKDVTVKATRSGTGFFGSGSSSAEGSTDKNGVVDFYFNGSGSVTVGFDGDEYGQSADAAGKVGTTAVTASAAGTALVAQKGLGAALAPAGINSVTLSVEGTPASQAAAEAAADAAAEAIDAANAATDAANLAAEAADAATVAAEEARDAADAATAAVEELATQVATLMAALKAQITTLANTVAKIAKKVKA